MKTLGLKRINPAYHTGTESGGDSTELISSYSPIDGELLGKVRVTRNEEYNFVLSKALLAQKWWQNRPAPKRGDLVRLIGNAFRDHKQELGKLVSTEMGKSLQEGMGEVQEIIDICDYAVGLSRQLYGLTMPSERPGHKLQELWHPLGVVGVISAFNFPVAVWSWNAMIALVCGNVVMWKPSEKTPLCAVAIMNILRNVLKSQNIQEGLLNVVQGDYQVGEWMTADYRISLISATGSTKMGKIVAQTVGARLGKCILELGGNNAIIITPSADLKIVVTGAVFGAIGTAGQRCTSTRRLIIHDSIYSKVVSALKKSYAQINIGNPLDLINHMGPLIDADAVQKYLDTIETIKKQGGKIITPYGKLEGKGFKGGHYVSPCIAEVSHDMQIVQHETFAPILYVMRYNNLEEAITIQNAVPQGLSSAIMSNDFKEIEYFTSANGSDCGIANVNIGTSGAEIGGAFGGEKETGGGRESGSDSWKAYMRRQTVTINYSKDLPLAQGIKFEIN